MKTIITVTLLIMITADLAAQQEGTRLRQINKVSIGVCAGHYGYDPSVGLEIHSPSFWKGRLKIGGQYRVSWLETRDVKPSLFTFTSYQTGVIYLFPVSDRMRLYSETGIVVIKPNDKFSDTKFKAGGYVNAGLELFFENKRKYNICYFFATGYQHVNASTEKLELKISYATGVVFTNGLRFYF